MEIVLAGCNIDYEILDAFRKAHPERDDLTPETIAAAYARISRDPRPVTELRAAARREVEKARQSNRNIVFSMGHSSIAEHAVFNIDVLGISRLLTEEVQKSRLVSYTEKSQRYILLEDDFVVPGEIAASGLRDAFVETVQAQNGLYRRIYEKLRPSVFEKHADLARERANHSLLDGWAKEDARYVIPLATQTQFGMTLNARNLELMVRRLASSPLEEGREYSRRIYAAIQDVAPSLVRYVDPTPYDLETPKALKETAAALRSEKTDAPRQENAVALIQATPGADERIVAALIHRSSDMPMAECLNIAAGMPAGKKAELIKTVCRHMKAYDSVPREFEYADLHFELTVSATCFAQLKRHRMAAITVQDYDPGLGVTVPPAIREIGMEKDFMTGAARAEETYERIRKAAPAAAAYILTNAHRRRVSLKINARELYHIARLRADRHAQWDIRETAKAMVDAGRTAMPLTLMLAAGKDCFPALHEEVFAEQSPCK